MLLKNFKEIKWILKTQKIYLQALDVKLLVWVSASII